MELNKLMKIAAVCLASLTAIFISVYIYRFVFYGENAGGLSNETVLGMLAFIIAVAGAANYFFYEVAKHDLAQTGNERMKKFATEERDTAKVETHTTLAYMLWVLYVRDNDETLLDRATYEARVAESHSQSLNSEVAGDAILNAENTYGYFLAEKQHRRANRKEKPDPKEKERALEIKDKIWKLTLNGDIKRMSPNRPSYEYEETCAWILFCFAESEIEKETARQIVKGLAAQSPANWYAEVAKRYDL